MYRYVVDENLRHPVKLCELQRALIKTLKRF